MELRITPTPDQEAFIQDGIASGRFDSADQIAQFALQRWEEYERRRAEKAGRSELESRLAVVK